MAASRPPKARELWTFSKVNFARLAEDMGALGIRVEQPSAFPAALAQALAANRPAVIDVVTDIEALAPTAWPRSASHESSADSKSVQMRPISYSQE